MHFIESQRMLTRRGSHDRRPSLPDKIDDVVEIGMFQQILALDEADSTREFSRTLISTWCDQAEFAVEEMEHNLVANDIVDAALKAHYLKGSSSSLGLTQVSKTCQTIYNLHYPPGLAYLRANSSDNSSFNLSFGSSSGSSSGSSFPSTPDIQPCAPPALAKVEMDFNIDKIDRARAQLTILRRQIKQASEWLSIFYSEGDKIAKAAAGNTA